MILDHTKLKLVFLASILLVGVLVLQAGSVQAQADVLTGCTGAAANSTVCQAVPDAGTGPGGGLFGANSLVANIVQIIIFVSGGIAFLMVAVGGLRYVLSQGDPQATASAKNTIIYAIAGLIIALISELILQIVLTRL